MIKKLRQYYPYIGWPAVGLLVLFALSILAPQFTMNYQANAITKDDPITAEVNTNVAALVRSSISVAVTSKVDLDLTPSSKGTFSTSAAKLDVTTNNTTGYAVYLRTRDDSSTLRPAQTGVTEVIGAPTGTITESNYANNLDTWGYAITSSSNDSITTSGNVAVVDSTKAEYQAIPTSTDPAIMRTDKTDQEDSYELSFGVAISPTLPSGIYNNEVIVSVVANPIEVRSLIDLTFMQDMTPEVCKISIENETKQLIDSRDGKAYWVAKLKDGNCWMVQNLALDLSTDKTLTSSDTDLSEAPKNEDGSAYRYTPLRNTMQHTMIFDEEVDHHESFDPGQYVLIHPTVDAVYCDPGTGTFDNMASCSNTVTEVSGYQPTLVHSEEKAIDVDAGIYDAHYLLGNYYTYGVATAGSGDTLTNGDAPASICPKGWKLPTSGWKNNELEPANTDTYKLFAAYGWNNGFTQWGLNWSTKASDDAANLFVKPVYLARSGSIYRRSGTIGNSVGLIAELRLSAAYSATQAYRTHNYYPQDSYGQGVAVIDSRAVLYSIRCLAR